MDAILESAKQQIIDLFSALGLTIEERTIVIEALADHTVDKPVISREQLIAKDLPQLIPFLQALKQEDLEAAFLCMFPGGHPSMITQRIDLEYYIRAAVAKERLVSGLPVTK